MGTIEAGVRKTLKQLGVSEPVTALECLAIELASTLDNGVDEKTMAALSRELRLTIEQVGQQSGNADSDKVRALMDKNR
jgi:hypothetical protein